VLVREGDVIPEDAPLLEVETDKAQVEIPSPIGGRVEKIHVTPGQTVKVGGRARDLRRQRRSGPGRRPRPARRFPRRVRRPTADRAGRARCAFARARDRARRWTGGRDNRLPAGSPRELGVDLRAVRGSGPGGPHPRRRRARDHGGPAAGGSAPAARPRGTRRPRARRSPLAAIGARAPRRCRASSSWGPVERAPLSHLRRTIAERMTLSATLIPHVTHFDRADITDLDAIITRNHLEPARGPAA